MGAPKVQRASAEAATLRRSPRAQPRRRASRRRGGACRARPARQCRWARRASRARPSWRAKAARRRAPRSARVAEHEHETSCGSQHSVKHCVAASSTAPATSACPTRGAWAASVAAARRVAAASAETAEAATARDHATTSLNEQLHHVAHVPRPRPSTHRREWLVDGCEKPTHRRLQEARVLLRLT